MSWWNPSAPDESTMRAGGDWSGESERGDRSTDHESTQTWVEIRNGTEAELPFELLDRRWQTYLKLIYMVTAGTSIILNVITVIVLYRGRRSGLRGYLINLSISDLLMSVFSIPFTYSEYMLGQWLWPAFLCPVVRFVVTLSVFESSATMTVIGLNRYLALMHPMRKKKEWQKYELWTRKSHVITGLWIIGVAISSPEYFMHKVTGYRFENNIYYECQQTWSKSISDTYTIFIYASTFFIPLIGLSYLYGSIGLMLSRRKMPGNVDLNRDQAIHAKRVKVINMLTVVVVLYAASWLPMQTFMLVTFLMPDLRKDMEVDSLNYNIFAGSFFAFHWMSMAHSCLNPLIYCFMNDKFRSDLRTLFLRRRNQNALSSAYSVKQMHQHHLASQQQLSSQHRPTRSSQLRAASSIGSLQSSQQRLEEAELTGGLVPSASDPEDGALVEERPLQLAGELARLKANASSPTKAGEPPSRRPLARSTVVKLNNLGGKAQSRVLIAGHLVEAECGPERQPDIEEVDELDDELSSRADNFARRLVARCTNYSSGGPPKQTTTTTTAAPKVPLGTTSIGAERAFVRAPLRRHSVAGGADSSDDFVHV